MILDKLGLTTEFQSTLPMQGATSDVQAAGRRYKISIHAPHTGSDSNYIQKNHSSLYIIDKTKNIIVKTNLFFINYVNI